MTPPETFSALLRSDTPLLALAPMQDVTTLQFMRVIARYGGPDVYWTEYFRVHGDSRPEKWILDSITKNPTGRPVVAQMIGNDIPALVRTAKLLQQYPVAAIDLNLGCPAPIVYRKCAGGGLLREPPRIDAILGALRDAVAIPFTVKTRIGFESPVEFDALLTLFAKHPIDLLTVHARTVAQMYRPGVRYDLIAQAARELKCPVLANGNVFSAAQAQALVEDTGVARTDDWARRDPQSVAVRPNPRADERRKNQAAGWPRGFELYPRTLGQRNHARRRRNRHRCSG